MKMASELVYISFKRFIRCPTIYGWLEVSVHIDFQMERRICHWNVPISVNCLLTTSIRNMIWHWALWAYNDFPQEIANSFSKRGGLELNMIVATGILIGKAHHWRQLLIWRTLMQYKWLDTNCLQQKRDDPPDNVETQRFSQPSKCDICCLSFLHWSSNSSTKKLFEQFVVEWNRKSFIATKCCRFWHVCADERVWRDHISERSSVSIPKRQCDHVDNRAKLSWKQQASRFQSDFGSVFDQSALESEFPHN